ncbi:hypothetical protein ACERK3_05500 [Phycisphaerales bacterium AB-hyl4]|uniref:Uncharacterized protein n=1 Tax=Natronomicrosphaera hydrolytica TaxID=3242702 RepID=A0ABV4U4J5_9BACT
MQTKTTDSKGRITLGDRFANRTVIIEEVDDTEVRVTLARIIPEREAWLYENREAKEAVSRGIEQAKQRRFAKGPDLAGDAKLADQIEDEG